MGVFSNSTNVSCFSDFYEEVLSLIYSLTSGQVSIHMWEVFPMIYHMFKKDGIDYFTGRLHSDLLISRLHT